MKRLLLCLMLLAANPVFAASFFFMTGAAEAAQAPGGFADPAMEARARNLQRQLRCLVCQGESIDESGAPLAADLRQLVRQQMAEGKSDSQIEAYLVARYGNFILMKPPLEPDTYILWLAPFLVLIGGAGVAIWVVSRARRAESA